MDVRYIKYGMNKDRQNKDSMLLVIIGYVALTGIIIGAAIGKLL